MGNRRILILKWTGDDTVKLNTIFPVTSASIMPFIECTISHKKYPNTSTNDVYVTLTKAFTMQTCTRVNFWSEDWWAGREFTESRSSEHVDSQQWSPTSTTHSQLAHQNFARIWRVNAAQIVGNAALQSPLPDHQFPSARLAVLSWEKCKSLIHLLRLKKM